MKTDSNFNFENLFFEDVFLIKIKKISDERGEFFESFKKNLFLSQLKFEAVQENISVSKKNVLRGMHFQKQPFAQSKLITVLKGKILDVFVDLRQDSKTYKNWASCQLDSKENKQLYLPKGFAHGFLALSDNVKVCYKVDNYYNRDMERSIVWNDETIAIKWPILRPRLSSKDANAKTFSESEKDLQF